MAKEDPLSREKIKAFSVHKRGSAGQGSLSPRIF